VSVVTEGFSSTTLLTEGFGAFLKKIAQAILDELVNSELTNLIGERIYYVKAPQDVEVPYVMFFVVSSVREHDHDGASHLASARFQFSIFAQTYHEAKRITEQIQSVLQAFSGTIGGVGGVYVSGSFHQNEVDFWEEDTGLYHVACDYSISHKE